MSDMLREMDHGPSALPIGSQLTLFNASTNVEIMARVKTRNRCCPPLHATVSLWVLHKSIGTNANDQHGPDFIASGCQLPKVFGVDVLPLCDRVELQCRSSSQPSSQGSSSAGLITP